MPRPTSVRRPFGPEKPSGNHSIFCSTLGEVPTTSEAQLREVYTKSIQKTSNPSQMSEVATTIRFHSVSWHKFCTNTSATRTVHSYTVVRKQQREQSFQNQLYKKLCNFIVLLRSEFAKHCSPSSTAVSYAN